MSLLTNNYDLGKVSSSFKPEDLAKELDKINYQDINKYKKILYKHQKFLIEKK